MRDVRILCRNTTYGSFYPIVNGIPVLINERNSVLRLADYTEHRSTFYQPRTASGLKRFVVSLIPEWCHNLKAADNFARLAALLRERPGRPRILVIGGSVFNRGMEPLLDNAFDLVETDVAFGERTQLIVDAHDIPFEDARWTPSWRRRCSDICSIRGVVCRSFIGC